MSFNKNHNTNQSLQLTQKACSLLNHLVTPHKREKIIEIISQHISLPHNTDISVLIDKLIQSEVLLPGDIELRDQTALFSDFYKALNPYHRVMLLDWPRTEAFRQAIQSIVFSGARVIDVGCGSGILSMFAATYGAEKVYAIEATGVIEQAKKIATINNLDKQIEFFHTYAQNFSVDRPVDIIISEWIGSFLFKEYMFDAAQVIRDRCLATGGAMLPKAAIIYIAPIEDSELYYNWGPGLWEKPYFGYDFSIGNTETPMQFMTCVVPHRALLASPQQILYFNCEKDNSSKFHFTKTVQWVVSHNSVCHGFVSYFDLILTDQITLSTSPSSPVTHWQQTYLPIDQIFLQLNDIIELTISSRPGGDGPEVTIEGIVIRNQKPITTFKKVGLISYQV